LFLLLGGSWIHFEAAMYLVKVTFTDGSYQMGQAVAVSADTLLTSLHFQYTSKSKWQPKSVEIIQGKTKIAVKLVVSLFSEKEFDIAVLKSSQLLSQHIEPLRSFDHILDRVGTLLCLSSTWDDGKQYSLAVKHTTVQQVLRRAADGTPLLLATDYEAHQGMSGAAFLIDDSGKVAGVHCAADDWNTPKSPPHVRGSGSSADRKSVQQAVDSLHDSQRGYSAYCVVSTVCPVMQFLSKG